MKQEMSGEEAQKKHDTIRVLHVTNVETINYYLNNLFDYTDPREIEISAVTLGPRGGFVEGFEQRGATAIALDCNTRSKYFEAGRHLRRIIERRRIDIVHTHLYYPTLLGLLIGKMLKRKVVYTRHHSDAIHKLPGRLKRAGYLFGERMVNRYLDEIIAPSRMVYQTLVEVEGVPSSKVSLIPYGQSPERFDAISAADVRRVRQELGMANRVALVCVSRLHQEKGHQFLFEAFRGLRRGGVEATLFLVGEGPEEERLRSIAGQMGIAEEVRFLGWRDDALTILAAADVVVHASLHEALPSVVIEALMLERPLVATDVSGVRDVAGDSEYGLVVPAGDSNALEDAIVKTLENLEDARHRAREGREHVLRSMGAASVARKYTDCYRRVMEPLKNGEVREPSLRLTR